MAHRIHPETGFPLQDERPQIPEPTFGRRFFVGIAVSAVLGAGLAELINISGDSHPTPVDAER